MAGPADGSAGRRPLSPPVARRTRRPAPRRLPPMAHGRQAQARAPPQLPCIALPDATVLDISNKKRNRLRIPNDGGPCNSAGESMFFLHHNDGRCCVVNGLSGAATPLPELAALLESHGVNPCDDKFEHRPFVNMKIRKVVMSLVASNQIRHPLVAVLASDSSKSRVFISTCRPAGEINSCFVMREMPTILDIAFFQEKIYAHLSMYEELVAVDLSNGCLDKPTPPGVEPEVKPQYTSWIWPPNLPDMYRQDLLDNIHAGPEKVQRYLVESNGKLLMVRRCFGGGTLRFEVFEADLSDGPRLGRWKKADSLDGRALFLGTACSKSVRASEGDGARRDCIYFLLGYPNPLCDSGVYSVADKMITPLMPESTMLRAKLKWDSRRFPAWFFPV